MGKREESRRVSLVYWEMDDPDLQKEIRKFLAIHDLPQGSESHVKIIRKGLEAWRKELEEE